MKGQTLIEYILIIGVVIAATYAMGPSFRRGVQTVIRSASDQLAVQKNAEQDFGDSGYLAASRTNTQFTTQRNAQETAYTTNTSFSDSTVTRVNTVTDMGFQAE